MANWLEEGYQGLRVDLVDDKVKCRHVRYGYEAGKLDILKNASLLMLEDGVMLLVCDGNGEVDFDGNPIGCGYNGITGRKPYVKPEGEQKPIIKQADSVMAHKSAVHYSKRGRRSNYSDDLITVAIKTYLKWKARQVRNWSTIAAAELEALGLKPHYNDHWTGNILVSLANRYMKEPKFQDVKAGEVTDADRLKLAKMVRGAAEREATGRKTTTVGATARITEKQPAHKHTKIDFDAIMVQNRKELAAAVEMAAAKMAEQTTDLTKHEETDVSSPTPTLSFSGVGGAPLETPTKPLVLDTQAVPVVPAPKPAPRVTTVAAVPASKSDFELVAELDGEPLFKYKGILMIGKVAKVTI